MVDRNGSMGNTHLHTTRHIEFVGMDFRLHAPLGGLFKHAGSFCRGKEPFVTEHIHIVGQALTSHFRNHFTAHEVNIFTLTSLIGTPHGMRAKKRGLDLNRGGFLDAANNPEHLKFIIGGKAVAALDFHSARTFGDNLVDTTHSLTVKLIFGCGMQQVGGIQDTSATGGNLLIAQPIDFIEELPGTVSGIYYMCMRVTERREHPSAMHINHFDIIAARHLPHFAHQAEVLDNLAVEQQPCIMQQGEILHLRPLAAGGAGGVDTG